jgi:hypothetical protein
MTKPESKFWLRLKKYLDAQPGIHYMRVENSAMPGTPDLNIQIEGYGEVWLELKFIEDWPKRPSTSVKLGQGVSAEQKLWLKKRARAGGKCGVLLGVGHGKNLDVFLYVNPETIQCLDEHTYAEMRMVGWLCSGNVEPFSGLPYALRHLFKEA